MRLVAIAIVLGQLIVLAPVQCGTNEPRPAEDSPPEVLFQLAEQFEREGDTEGRDRTLRFLVERYPSSRWTGRAEAALEGGTVARVPAQR